MLIFHINKKEQEKEMEIRKQFFRQFVVKILNFRSFLIEFLAHMNVLQLQQKSDTNGVF